MSIILGSGDALKDLPIGNKKISKVVVGNKVVWQKKWPGLKFTSQQDNSGVSWYVDKSYYPMDIYYSTDGTNWIHWGDEYTGPSITLNKGDSIYVWNKNNLGDRGGYFHFEMTGSIAASGNVDSMINFGELYNNCYYKMFEDCAALTTAPDLPATTLANECYNGMFQNCTSLTTAPDLPATNLVSGCYSYMFSGCAALTTAPDLPATTLAYYCYAYMFAECTSLTTAPDLPATNLASKCYQGMFLRCISLNSIKLSYTGTFDSNFSSWVESVSSSGTLYYNGSDTTRGSSAIPQNWAVQTF